MFVGKLLATSSADRTIGGHKFSVPTLRYAVVESFSGKQRVGDEVVIYDDTGSFGDTIGSFRLVQASGDEGGRMSMALCVQTGPSVLRELRTHAQGARLPDLSGAVETDDWSSSRSKSPTPLAGIPVTLTDLSTKAVFQALTDQQGIYTFAELPPGKYSVYAKLPSNKTTVSTSAAMDDSWGHTRGSDVEIPFEHAKGAACHFDYAALPAGQITVKLVDRSGNPVTAFVSAHPVTDGVSRQSEWVGLAEDLKEGSYSIRFLEAGFYRIAFGQGRYYPDVRNINDAKPVEVIDGLITGPIVIVVKSANGT